MSFHDLPFGRVHNGLDLLLDGLLLKIGEVYFQALDLFQQDDRAAVSSQTGPSSSSSARICFHHRLDHAGGRLVAGLLPQQPSLAGRCRVCLDQRLSHRAHSAFSRLSVS